MTERELLTSIQNKAGATLTQVKRGRKYAPRGNFSQIELKAIEALLYIQQSIANHFKGASGNGQD